MWKQEIKILAINLLGLALVAILSWMLTGPEPAPRVSEALRAITEVSQGRNARSAYALGEADVEALQSRGILKDSDLALLRRYIAKSASSGR